MKIFGTFGVVVIASIAFLQPAEGRGRAGGFGGGRSFGGGGHSFSSGGSFSSGSRNFSSSPRYYSQATRSYSQPAYRNGTYARSSSRAMSRNRVATNSRQFNRTAALNPRVDSRSAARAAGNRTAAVRPQNISTTQRRALTQQSRNWNRHHDHNWNGNRCRWHNNSWVIIGPWYPWGYGW